MDEKLKLLDDKNFITSSKWVEENDEDVYDWLIEKLKEWGDDTESFENGEWFVEYSFHEGDEEIILKVWASENLQDLANQGEWLTLYMHIYNLHWFPVGKYLEEIGEV